MLGKDVVDLIQKHNLYDCEVRITDEHIFSEIYVSQATQSQRMLKIDSLVNLKKDIKE